MTRGRVALRGLAALTVAMALVGCTLVPSDVPSDDGLMAQSSGSDRSATAPAPDEGRGVATLKPVMQGLVDRWAPPDVGDRDAVVGFVVTIEWAEIHPAAGVLDTSRLDAAIATAASSSPELQLKLRILGGIAAPEWVKALDGATAPIVEPHSSASGDVGRFWEQGHGDAYAELHRLLAAKYDGVEVLREVTISQCSTIFAEPLIRQMSSPDAVVALERLGYTPALDLECQRDQFDAHTVWQRTRSGFAINPYQVVGEGTPRIDLDITVELMRTCRQVLGARCVLQNNSIRTPELEGTMATMYDQMEEFGGPMTFQTAAPERVGDLGATLEWAADRGATAVELPQQWQALVPADRARRISLALQDNVTGG